MSLPERKFDIPSDLYYKDTGKLLNKLAHFATAGAAQTHVVFDFDRTLTMQHPGTQEDITSWNILQEHLPIDAQQQCAYLYQKYRVKELDGTMTTEDAVQWWSSVLDIYTMHHLDMNAVERDFLTRASIRTGAVELFQQSHDLGMPTVILSAGVKEVIDLWSQKYNVSPSLVLSTELNLDAAGKITGWDRSTLVHILNKAEANHDELHAIRREKPFSIVIGDSIHDADMANGEDNVLRIRILDPRPDEPINQPEERMKSLERFDFVLESRTLEPVSSLIATVLTDQT